MTARDQGKKVIVIESKEALDQIIDEAGNKHVLVEFYATWCGPCAIIGPRLEQLAEEYADRLLILKIDVDDHEDIAIEYDVTSMPTFLVLKNKVKLAQFVGSNSEKVESTVEKYCGKPDNTNTTAAAKPTPVAGPKANTTREVKENIKSLGPSKSASPESSPTATIEKKLQTRP
ncbi:thioredoxin-2 [Drosophila tropicalis]|uniref:thioredoxin-2 n=1 Tax=Drosophila tropicalis TaxID=46794 RepID=UPI0035ABC114